MFSVILLKLYVYRIMRDACAESRPRAPARVSRDACAVTRVVASGGLSRVGRVGCCGQCPGRETEWVLRWVCSVPGLPTASRLPLVRLPREWDMGEWAFAPNRNPGY